MVTGGVRFRLHCNCGAECFHQRGAFLRAAEEGGTINIHCLSSILNLPNGEKKEYSGFERIIMRFEDIKCNPKKEFWAFCER